VIWVAQNSTTEHVRHFTAVSDIAVGSSVEYQSISGYSTLEPWQETENLQHTQNCFVCVCVCVCVFYYVSTCMCAFMCKMKFQIIIHKILNVILYVTGMICVKMIHCKLLMHLIIWCVFWTCLLPLVLSLIWLASKMACLEDVLLSSLVVWNGEIHCRNNT
jgi:hypothetical protein